MHTKFNLYATCLPVKGKTESVICDIERGRLKRVPNLLFDILVFSQHNSVAATKAHFENRYDAGIDEYFQLLVNEDYAFFTSENYHFPQLELSWDYPATITNATVDITNQTNYDLVSVLTELNSLGCVALTLNWQKSLSELNDVLEYLRQSRFQRI